MFYFLLPYLPEVVMRSNDFSMLAATLRGKKGGVKNRENMTSQDLDVFKYALNSWGELEVKHYSESKIELFNLVSSKRFWEIVIYLFVCESAK